MKNNKKGGFPTTDTTCSMTFSRQLLWQKHREKKKSQTNVYTFGLKTTNQKKETSPTLQCRLQQHAQGQRELVKGASVSAKQPCYGTKSKVA